MATPAHTRLTNLHTLLPIYATHLPALEIPLAKTIQATTRKAIVRGDQTTKGAICTKCHKSTIGTKVKIVTDKKNKQKYSVRTCHCGDKIKRIINNQNREEKKLMKLERKAFEREQNSKTKATKGS